MPRRKSPFHEKPWQPDPAKWKKLLEDIDRDVAKRDTPTEPTNGWRLWDWNTLEDVKQTP